MNEFGLPQIMVRMPTLPGEYSVLAQKAERDVLGLLMLWGDVDSVDIEPGWFSSYQHLTIYYALVAAADNHPRADVVTVSEELELAGRLDEVGGLKYLGAIAKECPSLS